LSKYPDESFLQEERKMDASVPMDKKSTRSYWGIFVIFGLVNATGAILWGIYNNYLPIFMQTGRSDFSSLGSTALMGFGLSAFLTGVIMSIDNFIVFFSAPLFAAQSDYSKSRKKVIVLSLLGTAVLMALLPVVFTTVTPETNGKPDLLIPQIVTLGIIALLFVVVVSATGAYSTSLSYYLVPKDHYNTLSSVMVFFGGLSFVVVTFLANALYSINYGLPFWVASGFILLVMFAVQFFLMDEMGTEGIETRPEAASKNPITQLRTSFSKYSGNQLKGILLTVLTKLLGTFGTIGFSTFGSSYLLQERQIPPDQAGFAVIFYFIGYTLFAIPMGLIADKISIRKTWYYAMAVTVLAGVAYLTIGVNFMMICIINTIAGVANAAFDVSAIPLAMDFVPNKHLTGSVISIFTPLTTLATVVAVPLIGAIVDATGKYGVLFYLMSGCALLGFFGLAALGRLQKATALQDQAS
jgi:MFS family permease